jgi:hypothetical protein
MPPIMSKHNLANFRIPSQNMQIQCNLAMLYLAMQIDLYALKNGAPFILELKIYLVTLL